MGKEQAVKNSTIHKMRIKVKLQTTYTLKEKLQKKFRTDCFYFILNYYILSYADSLPNFLGNKPAISELFLKNKLKGNILSEIRKRFASLCFSPYYFQNKKDYRDHQQKVNNASGMKTKKAYRPANNQDYSNDVQQVSHGTYF